MQTALTLEKMVNAYFALKNIGERDGIAHAPAYWIASTLRRWRPDVDGYNESRNALYKKYGTVIPAPDGDTTGQEYWSIPNTNLLAFQGEIDALLALDVDTTYTVHKLSWLGEKISGEIEPSVLDGASILFERPPIDLSHSETMRLRDVEEAQAAALGMARHRMPEDLAWWVVSLLEQFSEPMAGYVRLRQKIVGEHANDPDTRIAKLTKASKDEVEIKYKPRKLSDFGALVEKWHPVELAPILFALTGE